MEETRVTKLGHLFDTTSLEQTIQNFAAWATKKKYNLAIFRKPGQEPVMFVDPEDLQKVNAPIEELERGFLWADYEGNVWHQNATLVVDLKNHTVEGNLNLLANNQIAPTTWKYYTIGNEQPSTPQHEYLASVQKGIKTILNSELIKVVPSKVKLYDLKDGFSLASAFVNLCEKYPSAFVSVVSNAEFGTWLTATPEMLIEVDKNGIFKTMALAGTQKYDPVKSLHEVAWTDKEIEEQAMVSRYIINRLKEIRLREFVEEGPMTVRAANLTHLCSTFTVDTKATNFPNLGGVMLNLLHPTSAVCGMPKGPAIHLIKEIESHNRKFYTGYLGPVNFEDHTSVYVNLRCMELFENKANLFAGAGVTAFSDPEKEWIETELKCNTLLNVIE